MGNACRHEGCGETPGQGFHYCHTCHDGRCDQAPNCGSEKELCSLRTHPRVQRPAVEADGTYKVGEEGCYHESGTVARVKVLASRKGDGGTYVTLEALKVIGKSAILCPMEVGETWEAWRTDGQGSAYAGWHLFESGHCS